MQGRREPACHVMAANLVSLALEKTTLMTNPAGKELELGEFVYKIGAVCGMTMILQGLTSVSQGMFSELKAAGFGA